MVNLQVSKEGGEEKERGSIVARLQLFPPFHNNCSLLSSVLHLENQSIYNFSDVYHQIQNFISYTSLSTDITIYITSIATYMIS